MKMFTSMVALAALSVAGCGDRTAGAEGQAAASPSAAPASSSPAASPQAETVRFTGTLDADNAARVLEQIGEHQDDVVGLRATITPSSDADFETKRYLVSVEPDMLGVTGGTTEVVMPTAAYRSENGAYVVDGFFLVKSGGMHQGTISYGLEPVAAGDARLQRSVVERPMP